MPPPKNWLEGNRHGNFSSSGQGLVRKNCIKVNNNFQLEKCIIEIDCLSLIQAIKAKTSLAEADAIIRDILHLLNEAPDVVVTCTPRDGNNLAHQLAAMAAKNGLKRQWIVNPPAQIKNTIRIEASRSKIYRIIQFWLQFLQAIKDNIENTFYLERRVLNQRRVKAGVDD
ncbi:hypothetical protein Ahy_A08g039348 isoform A [Arachis hypogaea]|uniref:RNase H type-1 domain-containing protein n=1 Tax=Arachis hypogaea TaxID=3818 RepID=A0A445BWJ0_ARAHY|nr:hypothetical protein Ahy_A08g039348 isoform A [Arachis hypogaea]